MDRILGLGLVLGCAVLGPGCLLVMDYDGYGDQTDASAGAAGTGGQDASNDTSAGGGGMGGASGKAGNGGQDAGNGGQDAGSGGQDAGSGGQDAGSGGQDAGGDATEEAPCTHFASCGAKSVCIQGQCQPALRVFAIDVAADGVIGAYIGDNQSADTLCNQEAKSNGLQGQWRAWLSSASDGGTPYEWAKNETLPRMLVDGTLVAATWGELVTGQLVNPISKNPAGAFVAVACIWTGTLCDSSATAFNCDNFSKSDAGVMGTSGSPTLTDCGWSSVTLQTPCSAKCGLYCFEY
ncbi:MAG: hypothetical protein HY898_15540 [Deltaproteobacteria bacterium]|nr:hypothetical protein [Deltaproteobacteria bacterium]